MSDYRPSTPPPGWYYADGDPPGTHRYWDGISWQGGPQAIPGSANQGVYGGVPSTGRPAGRGDRFVAAIVDGIALVVSIMPMVALLLLDPVLLFPGLAFPIGWYIYNHFYDQGRSGQTLGRRTMNIKLVRADTDQPAGGWVMFGRFVLQGVLNAFCNIATLVDLIFILASERRQRFTDGWLKLEVRAA